jgi:hypothetical protein
MLDLGCGLDREEQAELGPAPSLQNDMAMKVF